MPTTDDPNHPGIGKDRGDGQHEAYIVLSAEERAKGYVAPLRTTYTHHGIRPSGPTRELTEREEAAHIGHGYVLFEEYPESESPKVGRYWTRHQLDSGCGKPTIIVPAIAETYARDPSFYGSTFCCHCKEHLPLEEFEWSDGTVVGSVPEAPAKRAQHRKEPRGAPEA